VTVTWKVEEYTATVGDDDIEFIGRIRPDGTFEPALEGPNPAHGRSKINFCKALRDAGAVVEHVFVNFYYDIFPESKKVMTELGVRLHHLATWWDVLRVVQQGNYLAAAQVAEVEKFLNAPAEWSAAHGGASSFPSS
jgi:hypothetical protein